MGGRSSSCSSESGNPAFGSESSTSAKSGTTSLVRNRRGTGGGFLLAAGAGSPTPSSPHSAEASGPAFSSPGPTSVLDAEPGDDAAGRGARSANAGKSRSSSSVPEPPPPCGAIPRAVRFTVRAGRGGDPGRGGAGRGGAAAPGEPSPCAPPPPIPGATPTIVALCTRRGGSGAPTAGAVTIEGARAPGDGGSTLNDVPHLGQRMLSPPDGTRRSSTW